MSNLNSKLKQMDLHLKDQFHIHMVFASLSDQFEAFIVNRQLFAVSPYGYQSPSPWSKRKKELKLSMVVQSTMFTIKIKRPFMLALPQRQKTRLACSKTINQRTSQWTRNGAATARRGGIMCIKPPAMFACHFSLLTKINTGRIASHIDSIGSKVRAPSSVSRSNQDSHLMLTSP